MSFGKNQFLSKCKSVTDKSERNFSKNEMIGKYQFLIVIIMNSHYKRLNFFLVTNNIDDKRFL